MIAVYIVVAIPILPAAAQVARRHDTLSDPARRGYRPRVGPNYPVGIRYLGDEVVEGGSRVDAAVWFGIKFAKGGVDYLSVSKGGRFEDARQPKIGEAVYPYTGESGYECMPAVLPDARGPFGRNVPLAAAIRRALRNAGHATPVVTSGGITTFEQAEGILERGRRTAWRPRGSRSPIPTGSERSVSVWATWCAAASSRTTARGSISATSRSRASSGTGSSTRRSRR